MDVKDIRELFEMFDESSLTELRYRKDGEEILLRRETTRADLGYVSQPATSLPARAQPEHGGRPPHDVSPAATEAGSEMVISPIVGTFYRAPSLDSEPFVREGQRVEKGQTLCILEAMKLMNQLDAEFPCTILRIIPANGALVEYGSPLFEVKRA